MSSFDHIIAIDAMGGDNSPDKVIEGISLFLKEDKNIFFNIYGQADPVKKSLKKFRITSENNYKIINCETKIENENSVRDAIKVGKDSSMWKAIESVKNNESDLIISSGNTGALLVISKLLIKMIDEVDKPAIAGLWPNFKGTSIFLDLGANIEFNEKNYLQFSKIGAELYKVIFDKSNPTVALLNVGSEEVKGHEELKTSFNKLSNQKNNFSFHGYIEGNEIKNGDVDIIVTDGFTGNIALKTAEGTANYITNEIKNIFANNLYGKFCYLVSYFLFKKIKKTLDPRKYNGGIFIGLNSPVIKSHGGADALAFYYSIKLSAKILRGNLIKRIKSNIENE
jgi:glycerol-3-phosphate acyltransferase PlsX